MNQDRQRIAVIGAGVVLKLPAGAQAAERLARGRLKLRACDCSTPQNLHHFHLGSEGQQLKVQWSAGFVRTFHV